MRLLIIEDDYVVAAAIRRAAQLDGHDAAVAGYASSAVELARAWAPDVILVDIGLPDGDGRDVVRTLRASTQAPIIIVSGRGGEHDRIAGLELGADDYVVKPFSVGELMARVRAVTRRVRERELAPSARLVHRDLSLDPEQLRAFRGDDEILLKPKEFEVLRLLMQNAGRVVRREQLAQAVWGLGARDAARTIDVHVSWLRAKLGDARPPYIETLRGVGFRLSAG